MIPVSESHIPLSYTISPRTIYYSAVIYVDSQIEELCIVVQFMVQLDKEHSAKYGAIVPTGGISSTIA